MYWHDELTIIGSKDELPIKREFSPFHMLKWVLFSLCLSFFVKKKPSIFGKLCEIYFNSKWNATMTTWKYNEFYFIPPHMIKVLTDIGSDALPAIPSKPVGAPASHSLITSPNYQLSPRSNYSTDVTTTTNIISNGNHSPVVRETSKTLQKTEVLHVDTTNSEPVP